jgi:uncharacterized protein with PQ loop repeat
MIWPLFGFIGGVCFAFAAVPTAMRCIRTGRASGTPMSIAWAVFVGCICLYTYLTGLHGFDWLLTLIYGVETASWGVVLWYGDRA